jgi:hypothetical protein
MRLYLARLRGNVKPDVSRQGLYPVRVAVEHTNPMSRKSGALPGQFGVLGEQDMGTPLL